MAITYRYRPIGFQSTCHKSSRHTLKSSHAQVVTRSSRHTVNSSHGQLVTRSTRHTVKSSHGQVVTRSSRHSQLVTTPSRTSRPLQAAATDSQLFVHVYLPRLHSTPLLGGPHWNTAMTFGMERLKWFGILYYYTHR